MTSKQRGFTIIEVLVAIAILATAIIIVSYFGGAAQDLRIAQTDTVATNFARTVLDTTRAIWSQKTACTAANGTNKVCTAYQNADLPINSAPTGFKYSVTVTKLNDGTVVASCPSASACVRNVLSSDTTVLNYFQRRVLVTVVSPDNRQSQLAMNVTRVDVQ